MYASMDQSYSIICTQYGDVFFFDAEVLCLWYSLSDECARIKLRFSVETVSPLTVDSTV